MDIYMNLLLWGVDFQKEDYPILEQLKEIGYDGVEFSLGSPSRDDYVRLGEFCRSIGLKLMTVCGGIEEANAVSPDAETRRAADQWIKDRIDDVVAAGSSNLGGPFHCVFNSFTGEPVTEIEIERSIDFLLKAGDYAQEKGVTLTPEFLNRYEAYFGNTMAENKNLLERVNHPHVRAMYDTFHANIEEKSQASALRTIAPYLTHVHLSENDRGTLGKGQVNFDEVFYTLDEIGFKGTFAIEAFSRKNEIFANAVNVWREYSPEDEILVESYEFARSKCQALTNQAIV